MYNFEFGHYYVCVCCIDKFEIFSKLNLQHKQMVVDFHYCYVSVFVVEIAAFFSSFMRFEWC